MNVAAVRVRPLATNDLHALATFDCSAGEPWEELVEQQVRGPLPRRYLASPPRFDGRMLLACDPAGAILAVGAHHIEPTTVPDVGYTEVVAVALEARRTLLSLPGETEITLGALMLLTILRQMRELGRHPRTFVRVDQVDDTWRPGRFRVDAATRGAVVDRCRAASCRARRAPRTRRGCRC